MNKTMLSVVALAVGAVLIIGLYNIYKPEFKGVTHDVFSKVDSRFNETRINYMYNGHQVGSQKVNRDPVINKSSLEIPEGYVYTGDNVRPKPYHSVNVNVSKAPLVNKNGMSFFNDGCGHLTIKKLNNNGWPWGSFTNDMPNATSIKFNGPVNASGATLDGLFANNNNVKSIDLGNDFHTENATGFVSLFEHDRNLTHLNLGPHFSAKGMIPYGNYSGAMNMFLGDKKLKSLSGNVPPEIQKAFNHRATPYSGSYEHD